MQSFLSRLSSRYKSDTSPFLVLPLAPLIGYYTVRILWTLLFTHGNHSPNIIPSPRKSLQLLSSQQLDTIPYPLDALPGARDIDTPYGNIRVYEWGPEDGRKVLFIHGISTPCIAFAGMARLLAEKGCRVMLFDLFGRGYSDTPDPKIYRQDINLFTSQILLVLSSSKLSWTGSSKFTLVGYSLGGGIGASYTSYFPNHVESLILVAPGGIIRSHHIGTSSRLLYSNLLPRPLVEYYIRRRLTGSSAPPMSEEESRMGQLQAAVSEVPHGHPAHAADSIAPIFPDRPRISPAYTVAWQTECHTGFLSAFISSIQHAPITDAHDRWRLIGSRLSAQEASSNLDQIGGLKEGQVLILLGKQDNLIIADEVEADATECLGKGNVKIVKLTGGHDLPIVNAQGCVDAIIDFWTRC
ncbi:hypothetical protein M433DRAFT_150360 [Acidomyces richmondensis BFW]|nr:MAG: hypothetical protein FE78DRAFT_94568 [Acidomyces sp. 'richmondensis']KYG49104.1 hypothetical protein M433DRAFT_150360 [Acidomyces richmondensis BFW]